MAAPTEEHMSENDSEENDGDSGVKCIMHIDRVVDEVGKAFTKLRWDKFRQCSAEWRKCNQTPQCSLIDSCQYLSMEFENIPSTLGYHDTCYRRFTDKTRIQAALKRKEAESESNTGASVLSPKRLRSKSPVLSSGSTQVLNPVCILCKRAVKYKTKNYLKVQDKLMQAETIDGGLLRKAAELKRDESILIHIRGKDCVALEVKYHASCYQTYTKFLSRKRSSMSTESDQQFAVGYKVFCEDIIQKRIIGNREILRMSKVFELFRKCVEKTEQMDVTNFRVMYLKSRLMRDFPELQFHAPKRRNVSEIVYVDHLSGLDHYTSETNTDTTGTESTDSETDGGHASSDMEKGRLLYNTGMLLHNVIKDTPGMDVLWPPTSNDLNVDKAQGVVPGELYNLLAWCTGASSEPPKSPSVYVDVSKSTHLKLLSICQDLVYLTTKGKRQTPKSLALGLTVRHLTGSSQLGNILNTLGHCASLNTVVSYETSLAQLQLLSVSGIPPGFSQGKSTILVWDNIDFGEETLSGRGTTHHTNGIMIQGQISSGEESERRTIVIDRARSLKPQPSSLSPYHQKKKQGPQYRSNVDISGMAQQASLQSSLMQDFAYITVKYISQNVIFPAWTGFNKCFPLHPEALGKSAIHYLPVIEASPTEMATVNTIFHRSIEMADRLNLDVIVLVFDQAIYAKAQQIRWNDETLTKRTVIRMGEFHTTMSYMSMIGKRFKDAGMTDIFIESELVAEGSINGVLSGHHYNRSIRAHKLLFEALQHCRFRAFMDAIPEQDRNHYTSIAENLVHECTNESKLVINEDLHKMMSEYERFVETKSQIDPTFAFWSSYIDIIQLLLVFIRATRESDWDLHLAATRCMLPWFFAYDRINYARYLPAYWLEMGNLQETHPQCYGEFTSTGQWTVQRQDDGVFASIACDQAIEQTCNRDSKTKGGISRFTLHRGAVQRWILAQPERAAITRQCEKMGGIQAEERWHKDLDSSRMEKDQAAVNALLSTINNMVNPFDGNQDELVSLSSGAVADDEVKADLLEAKHKGEDALLSFMTERLLTSDSGKDIFSPMKNMRLKTFENQIKQKKIKTKSGNEVLLKYDRKLFSRLLVIGQSRRVDLREVLQYSLGPVSFPLSNSDGSIAKTNKAALLQILEAECGDCLVGSVMPNGALLIDGMALIQSLGKIPATFGELSDMILINVINLAQQYHCSRVDFITDTYPSVSIKNVERVRRAASGSQKLTIHGKNQKTPTQWKKFLANGSNKETLAEFLFETWKEASYESIKQCIYIYITHMEKCHKIQIHDSFASVNECEELKCDHEEADTRLLLHAKHASEHYDSVVIRSPDTDVAVIALSLISEIDNQLYFATGVKNKARIIDLNKVSISLGPSVCSSLIGLHVFTGCDSVSSFHGKGKRKAFKVASGYEPFVTAFSELGTSFEITESLFSELETFVCHLYGETSTSDVNEARYKIFCTSPNSEQAMPPTKDALKQHCLRANYQACIHKRALVPWIHAPPPEGHGWVVEDECLSYKWMTKPAAPEAMLEVVHCNCKTGKCDKGRCSCYKAEVTCTDLCKCKGCNNGIPVSLGENEDSCDSDTDM